MKKIRLWLMRHNIRQREIAQKLKVSDAAISNFLSGKTKSKKIENFFRSEMGKK
jgi:transcriptional regulator with XRE-family HTH domain